MPRKSVPSTTIVQAVRLYFGLEQQELASFLGVTRAQVAHLEAGRRALSSRLLLRLNALAVHLPAAPPAPLPVPALAPGPLAARLDYCRHHAARLRRELRGHDNQAVLAARWAALPPEVAATTPAPARAQSPTPDDVARHHLLRLRAEALETEAAALAALLDAGAAENV